MSHTLLHRVFFSTDKLFTPIGFSLLVLAVVGFALVVRETTDYDPTSPFRLWTTRAAVGLVVLWFATGLGQSIALRGNRSLAYVLFSNGVTRGVFAILVIWVVFRDEF
jgi:hypothetical protein